MKVAVDADRCRGHSVCCLICPEVFVLTDGGYAQPRNADVPAEFEDAVDEAVQNCPEHAITTVT